MIQPEEISKNAQYEIHNLAGMAGFHSILSPRNVNYKARNSYLDRLEAITASVGKEGIH